MHSFPIAVVTASEARERDRRAIASGMGANTLMQKAGQAAAELLVRRYPELLRQGVDIYTGSGNNGGDGWVVASILSRRGISVRVIEAEPAKSEGARNAKLAATVGSPTHCQGSAGIVVDALLGTGSSGPPRGSIRAAMDAIMRSAEFGSAVVALDIPTGLDATSGEASNPVNAALTVTFASVKTGQLINRAPCGQIDVVDIGLGALGGALPGDLTLASGDWVATNVPAIMANAHKGSRKRLAIIAGDHGMAGAAILASRGAARSGIGLVHVAVAQSNRDAVHCGFPTAIVSSHDELLHNPEQILPVADAIVVGPGLTRETAGPILESLVSARCPIVLDAGGISAFDGRLNELADFCQQRVVVITPHPVEMARLLGISIADVLAGRFEVGAEVARRVGATVLLKGTPTIVSGIDDMRTVVARGTSALATGGSGDILSGIIGTMLAQGSSGFSSAVCAAWVHGRAAELCGRGRGITLDDVLYAMPAAWKAESSLNCDPLLASLPSVG